MEIIICDKPRGRDNLPQTDRLECLDCSRVGGFGRAPNLDAIGPNRSDDGFVY